jgi:hypothetical protein
LVPPARRSASDDSVKEIGTGAGRKMIELEVPERLLAVRYDADCFPGSPKIRDGYANCQSFAYTVLRYFGRTIPDFRSSELWDDADFTFVVEQYAPLDLILFNHTRSAFGAHIGVFVGENSVLHLARRVGMPAQWSLSEFVEIASYRVLVGGKRTRK